MELTLAYLWLNALFCMERRAAPYKWLLFSYMSFIMLTCLGSTLIVDIVWWARTKLRSEAEAPKPKPRSVPNSSFSELHGSLRMGMIIPVLAGSLFTGYSHIHKYIRCVYNIWVDVVCNSGRTETYRVEFLRCIFYFFLKYEVPHLSKSLLEVEVSSESTKCVSSKSCHQWRSFCRSSHRYSHTANEIYLEPARERGYLSIRPSRFSETKKCGHNDGDKIQCHLMSYKSSQDIIHFNRSEYEGFKYNIFWS